MQLYPIIRDAWGQLRGYRRWSIRREVARTLDMPPAAIAARSRQLAHARFSHALQQFPAYAELVKAHTGTSDLATVAFEQLPILSKSLITNILTTPHSPPSTLHSPLSTLIPHSTGGSTGQPFQFNITRKSYEWRTAVSDRGYSWAQAEEGQRSFYVWGTAIRTPGWKQRIKECLHHWLQHRKYFDSFDFTDARKAECCRQINRCKPVSIVGYSGNLIELAQYVARNPGVLTWRAGTAVTAAEGLRPGMRDVIEAHLVDEVFMSYGSREFMLIGMEGPNHDGYQIAADNLYVEVVDDNGKPLPPGELGRIVITDLHNDATPFVRYAIGDLGRMGSGAVPGETPHPPPSTLHRLPKLASVEGRLQEIIELANGEKLTALFIPHLMKEFGWVQGYQVVQEAPGNITVNLVSHDEDWKTRSGRIAAVLCERLGPEMKIRVQRVDAVQKTTGGKTPIVVAG